MSELHTKWEKVKWKSGRPLFKQNYRKWMLIMSIDFRKFRFPKFHFSSHNLDTISIQFQQLFFEKLSLRIPISTISGINVVRLRIDFHLFSVVSMGTRLLPLGDKMFSPSTSKTSYHISTEHNLRTDPTTLLFDCYNLQFLT